MTFCRNGPPGMGTKKNEPVTARTSFCLLEMFVRHC